MTHILPCICLILPGLASSLIVNPSWYHRHRHLLSNSREDRSFWSANINYKITESPFATSLSSTITRQEEIHVENVPSKDQIGNEIDNDDKLSFFKESITSLNLPLSLLHKVQESGFETSVELRLFAKDFVDRPEVLSSILQSDFGFKALAAHQTRSALMHMMTSAMETTTSVPIPVPPPIKSIVKNSTTINNPRTKIKNKEEPKKQSYKSVIVNRQAKNRRKKNINSDGKKNPEGGHEYGLPSNYQMLYPKLASELEEFFTFMTEQQPGKRSQESPIRPATANIYIRHAKLFLGWYISSTTNDGPSSILLSVKTNHTLIPPETPQQPSIYTIFPSDHNENSSVPIIKFLVYLRKSRSISSSYEANMLRGLLKLLKFRFSSISSTEPEYGDLSYNDIPVIRQVRKLHRDANKKQLNSPRSSDESLKWLDWEDYLGVIRGVKMELEGEISKVEDQKVKVKATQERKIAVLYQYYLILAFFSSVPDRQRTIRELELDRSFLFRPQQQGSQNDDDDQPPADCYIIKHGPDDYKTGGTYGERPLIPLPSTLTSSITTFITHYRPTLQPKSQHLFIQPSTGKPMTQDSIYNIVTRQCFKYTGKKTNPHLLRDMIVTHVRKKSDATERELEALALFMGHSIGMQRKSYDRRTMGEKVEPAVRLLRSVNGES